MTVLSSITMQRVSIDDLERRYRKEVALSIPPATMKEILLTLLVSALLTPFFFTTFFVLPLMGQIVVFFALFVTTVYLWARRSWMVTIASIVGSAGFAMLTFFTIQAIKTHLEIPLFIFLVLGVPVTAIYCMFLAMRIWALRSGTHL